MVIVQCYCIVRFKYNYSQYCFSIIVHLTYEQSYSIRSVCKQGLPEAL